jgi:adenylylsulfate kinase
MCIPWFFGAPASGKSSLLQALADSTRCVMLDGDAFRQGISFGLGFSAADRSENIRRAAEVAKILHSQRYPVGCAFVTPLLEHRALVRSILGDSVRMIELHCSESVSLQRISTRGRTRYTKIQDPSFDPGDDADLRLDTGSLTVEECRVKVVAALSAIQHS